MPTKLLIAATAGLSLAVAAATARAQSGSVSDFSGASVSNSALIGPFAPQPAAPMPLTAASHAALREIASKVGVSLNAGTVAGGGFLTSGEGVQALGRLMYGPGAAPAGARQTLAGALRPSGASEVQINRLLSALAGLLMNPAAEPTSDATGNLRRLESNSGTPSENAGGPNVAPLVEARAAGGPMPRRGPAVDALLPANLTPAAVAEAASAFADLVNSANAEFLRDPPPEFLAVYSTLFELICAQDVAAGIPAPMCTAPNFLIDQPPPKPLVNRDSIAAAEAARAAAAVAAAAKARTDSLEAAAERARADSIAAVTSVAATAHARAVLATKIYFDNDQFTLHPNAKTALDAKLQVLEANPDVRIRIEGYIDPSETGVLSQTLGWLRAEQARSYLIAGGIADDRIEIVNRSAAHPTCTDRREACRAQNRRDEFVIVAGGTRMRMP